MGWFAFQWTHACSLFLRFRSECDAVYGNFTVGPLLYLRPCNLYIQYTRHNVCCKLKNVQRVWVGNFSTHYFRFYMRFIRWHEIRDTGAGNKFKNLHALHRDENMDFKCLQPMCACVCVFYIYMIFIRVEQLLVVGGPRSANAFHNKYKIKLVWMNCPWHPSFPAKYSKISGQRLIESDEEKKLQELLHIYTKPINFKLVSKVNAIKSIIIRICK